MTNSDIMTTNTAAPVVYSESSSELERPTFTSFDGDSDEGSYEPEPMISNDFCPLNEW